MTQYPMLLPVHKIATSKWKTMNGELTASHTSIPTLSAFSLAGEATSFHLLVRQRFY